MITLSVIMPVYNGEKYLHQAIESILCQTFEDFEFIIVDDASTDRSVAIIQSYADDRIVLVRNEYNIGNYPSRNKGLNLAKGKYIGVMDADDIADYNRLEKQYTFMEQNPDILAAGSDIKFLAGNNTCDFQRLRVPDRIQVALLKDNCCTHPSLIIRSSIFLNHGLKYNETFYYAADYNLMVEIAQVGKIANIDEFLLYYRMHASQISIQKHREQKKYADQIRIKQLSFLSITPSEEEKKLHLKLMKGLLLKQEEIQITENWIKKLLNQNAKLNIYKQAYLVDFLRTQLAHATPSLISVVMPVYNMDTAYLKETVSSILRQTFTNFELLIVDDGSDVDLTPIVESFRDNRIRLIRNHHDFISTLNRGLNEAKGKYIARMDADDIMLPHRLQTQYNFMEQNPEIDICGSWAESFGKTSGIMQTPTTHFQIVGQLLLGNVMIHPTVMMRKSSLNGVNYSYGFPCAEDYKLWTYLALIKGLHFANIPEILLKYRISEQQVTQVHRKEMMDSTLKIRLEYIEQIMERLGQSNERYINLFNPLINAVNEELISFDSLGIFIRDIYYIKC